MDKFKNYFDLAAHKKEGRDFAITTREVTGSNVAIVAPHGGHIDRHTEEMAKAIAAEDYSLYVFSGMQSEGSFRDLHITSIHFDEPRCVEMVAKTDVTLTIHGCRFEEPMVCLSGMDKKLQSMLAAAFNAVGVKALTSSHPYQTGKLSENICNKNKRGQGVQLEFSRGIRNNREMMDKCIKVVRDTLKAPAVG